MRRGLGSAEPPAVPAQFDGWCEAGEDSIAEGDMIVPWDDEGERVWIHESCRRHLDA